MTLSKNWHRSCAKIGCAEIRRRKRSDSEEDSLSIQPPDKQPERQQDQIGLHERFIRRSTDLKQILSKMTL